MSREHRITLTVSDHAVLRYLERGLGYDVEAFERRVIEDCGYADVHRTIGLLEATGIDVWEIKKNMADGANIKSVIRDWRREVYIKWRGVTLVVKDYTIVTVLDRDMPAKCRPNRMRRRERKRKRRNVVAA